MRRHSLTHRVGIRGGPVSFAVKQGEYNARCADGNPSYCRLRVCRASGFTPGKLCRYVCSSLALDVLDWFDSAAKTISASWVEPHSLPDLLI